MLALSTMPALLWAAPAPPALGTIHLAHASQEGYPFDQRPDFPAGDYLALQCTGPTACALSKSKLTVKAATINSYGGKAPGFVVADKDKSASLFLIRGLAALREGPVTTWYANLNFQHAPFHTTDDSFSSKQILSVEVDKVALEIIGKVGTVVEQACGADQECPTYPSVSWRFRFGGIERTLYSFKGNELGTPIGIDDFVVWIGDIDGDGKPDLVLRPQERSDYLELSLFLSSTLLPGKPWRPSAKFYYWDPANPGC
ncbi:MAG: hypothetical protein V4582_11055 [Pseudomonadota bacterium]